jgi:hypothetical protein
MSETKEFIIRADPTEPAAVQLIIDPSIELINMLKINIELERLGSLWRVGAGLDQGWRLWLVTPYAKTSTSKFLRPNADGCVTVPDLDAAVLGRPVSTDAQENRAVIELARKQWSADSHCEIEDNARVSHGEDNGAYVAAWLWVDFAGSGLDKNIDLVISAENYDAEI